MAFYIAQGFGLLCLIAFIFSTRTNNRMYILTWRTISNIFAGIQYILLGSASGLIINIVGSLRNIAYARVKKGQEKHYIIIFSLLVLISGVLSILFLGDKPVSMLITIYSLILTIFIGQKDNTLYRISQVVSAPILIIYNISMCAYVGTAVSIIQTICMAMSVKKFDEKRIQKDIKKQKRLRKKFIKRIKAKRASKK